MNIFNKYIYHLIGMTVQTFFFKEKLMSVVIARLLAMPSGIKQAKQSPDLNGGLLHTDAAHKSSQSVFAMTLNRTLVIRTLILFALVNIYTIVLAQEPRFTATVNKNKVALNSNFQLTFTLENGDGKNFQPPSFNDFVVLSGPSQSTSMQIINGNVTRSISFSYYLRPKKEGTFTLAPATIFVGGKAHTSNSVTIEALSGGSPDQQSQQQGGDDIMTQISNSVFVRLIVDKTEVYQGEQVTVQYKLYYNMPISNTSITKAPTFTGFWVQDLEMPQNIQFTPEVLNGVQYNAAVIKKDALFPQRAGELEIDAMELQSLVRVRVKNQRNLFFDDFFGTYQDYPHKFNSNAVKLKVKPLPTAGVPASFNGAVGEFKMDVKLDKTETTPDEPVSLSIAVSGTGNIKMLDLPKINLPADLEVFDPKSSERISKKNSISGSKSNEYLIIPRRAGEFKIPPVEFSYFDLKKQQYVTQQTPGYVIRVEGDATASTTPVISGITKEEVELLGQDIRFIKTGDTTLRKKDDYLLASWQFAGMYAAPFLLFMLLFIYKRREEKLSGNLNLLRKRRANKEAAIRLKKAKQHLTAKERKPFFDEITKAVWGFLGDKLSIDPSALSREQAQKIMLEKKISEATIQCTFKLLDDAEMALFAPSSDGDMDVIYKEAGEVIEKVGDEGG